MMDQKEKNIQRALGTLPTFSVKIRVDLEAANRQDALKDTRDMIRFIRKHYPNCLIRRGVMKEIFK